MEFNLNEFAKEVHRNAVEHGWWEGERCIEEILALIHSEWSEALEEYRAGRPMVWHKCPFNNGVCENQEVHTDDAPECVHCSPEIRKPEGVAVELIDGCIRILDYFASTEFVLADAVTNFLAAEGKCIDPKFTKLIATLHKLTAKGSYWDLLDALLVALRWVREQKLDPVALMQEKHEYNKKRPYKHGGKVC